MPGSYLELFCHCCFSTLTGTDVLHLTATSKKFFFLPASAGEITAKAGHWLSMGHGPGAPASTATSKAVEHHSARSEKQQNRAQDYSKCQLISA